MEIMRIFPTNYVILRLNSSQNIVIKLRFLVGEFPKSASISSFYLLTFEAKYGILFVSITVNATGIIYNKPVKSFTRLPECHALIAHKKPIV